MRNKETLERVLYVLFIILPMFAVVGWETSYLGETDERNPHYICWKMGICPMDLHFATETVIHDPTRMDLIGGKTVAELEKKFGYVTKEENATSYLQWSYNNSDYKGKDVVFLRDSDLMVVLENGRGVDAVYVKG